MMTPSLSTAFQIGLMYLTTNPNEFKLEIQKPSNVNFVDP